MTLFCIRRILVRYKEFVCNNEFTVKKKILRYGLTAPLWNYISN